MARTGDQHTSTESLANHFGLPVTAMSTAFIWSVEMLTVKQFAQKMQVGETTVWNLIGNQTLKSGRHYWRPSKDTKTIRFPWGPELIKSLMDDCVFASIETGDCDDSSEKQRCKVKPTKTSKTVVGNVGAGKCHQGEGRASENIDDLIADALYKNPSPSGSSGNGKRRRFEKSPINPNLLKR